MTESQGFVSGVDDNGWAEVVFHAGDPGIPGAPDVKVCHCSGGSARMTIKAINRAGAGAGDLVAVSRPPGAVIRTATTLFGIPTIGLTVGVLVGLFLAQQAGLGKAGALAAAAIGLLAGIWAAVRAYRRMSVGEELTLIITRVIKRSTSTSSHAPAVDPVCKMQVDPATAAASLAYQDKTYYFCHPGCREAFAAEPAKYV